MQTIQMPAIDTKTAPTGVLTPAEGLGAVPVASTVDGDDTLILTVPASVWAERLVLKAELAAKKKAIEDIDKALGFPEADSIGRACRILVVNGNGQEVGKGCVYWFKGATYEPGWRSRIS